MLPGEVCIVHGWGCHNSQRSHRAYQHNHRRNRASPEDPTARVVVGGCGASPRLGRAAPRRSVDVGVHMSRKVPPPTAADEAVHKGVRTVAANHTPTGAGSESAEGIHGSGKRLTGERSGLDSRDTGRSFRAGADRSGSEPLVGRDWVHESGYGGKGGAPRISSEQRETAERASGASSADASDAIKKRLPEQIIEQAANSDTVAPDPKAGRAK
jgi:hypothetical protein